MTNELKLHNFSDLDQYRFVVPDFQREYAWQLYPHINQFLNDINDAYTAKQDSYRMGQINIAAIDKNSKTYSVVDGQQRLTTVVLTLCVMRDLLKERASTDRKLEIHAENIKTWLNPHPRMGSTSSFERLTLQYRNQQWLPWLIKKDNTPEPSCSSNSARNLQEAYRFIKKYFDIEWAGLSADEIMDYVVYFTTSIYFVVDAYADIGECCIIYERLNSRGLKLSSVDLFKNLLFKHVLNTNVYDQVKNEWLNVLNELEKLGEELSPSVFLRYYIQSRYHGVGPLKSDNVYNWVVNTKPALIKDDADALNVVKDMKEAAARYVALVKATEGDMSIYPSATRIGLITQRKARQHILLLLALPNSVAKSDVDYLAQQIESFFWYALLLGINSNDYEKKFMSWIPHFRKALTRQDIEKAVENTMVSELKPRASDARNAFTFLTDKFTTLKKLKYVLGRLENRMRLEARDGVVLKSDSEFEKMQVEHIFPQTPGPLLSVDNLFTNADLNPHQSFKALGNLTLLEPTYNQSIAGVCNNVQWFASKQQAYAKSECWLTKYLNHAYSQGTATLMDKYRSKVGYIFSQWDVAAVQQRQGILHELACETFVFNGKRLY